MQSNTRQSLQSGLSEIAMGASANMANWLNGKLAMTKAIADRVSRYSDQQALIDTLSLANQGGEFTNLYFGNEQGEFFIDETSTDSPEGYDPRSRPWYQLAKAKNVVSFTEPYIDAFTNQLLITAVAPINQGGFVGVAGGDLTLNVVSDIVNQIDFMGLGHAVLVTGQGKVLAHPDKAFTNKMLDELFTKESPDFKPVLQHTATERGDKLVGFFKVEGVPSVDWYLAVEIDEDKAYAPIHNFRNMAIIITIVGALLTIVLLSLLLAKLTNPLRSLQSAMDEIAQGEGDLTRRLEVVSNDEIGKLATSFNIFVSNIHMLIEDFKGSSENLASMVKNMADISAKSRHEVERQKQETEMVATAVAEMSSAAHEIAQNAQEAASAAQEADKEGSTAGKVVASAISSIQQLAEEIDQASHVISELETDVTSISSVLDVIRGIAEQTNLLALNAAIEAARAGEQGRGFAVVADEVRTLASKTQESTEEINQMIERLQKGAQRAVAVMADSKLAGSSTVEKADEAGKSLSRIASSVSTISDMNVQIAAASEQQTAVTEEITRSITTIADATEITAEAAGETANTSEILAEIGQSIKEKVNRFKV